VLAAARRAKRDSRDGFYSCAHRRSSARTSCSGSAAPSIAKSAQVKCCHGSMAAHDVPCAGKHARPAKHLRSLKSSGTTGICRATQGEAHLELADDGDVAELLATRRIIARLFVRLCTIAISKATSHDKKRASQQSFPGCTWGRRRGGACAPSAANDVRVKLVGCQVESCESSRAPRPRMRMASPVGMHQHPLPSKASLQTQARPLGARGIPDMDSRPLWSSPRFCAPACA
jgi:hypothetical protein